MNGITIEKDCNGIANIAHIDLHKYGKELEDFFKSKNIFLTSKNAGNPAVTGILPQDCITMDEFRDLAMKQAKEFCKEHDIH